MMTLCYIHVPGDAVHNAMEDRFLESYKSHPPGIDHETLIICQGAEPAENTKERYRSILPACQFLARSGAGLDIGGYIDAASVVQTNAMLCCGGSTTVRRAGWMARMVEAWRKHGAGFYGSLSSYQVRPHFNTTGFWLEPSMLRAYPRPVNSTADRYEFEHGPGALWWVVNQMGFPTKLVTWCGEYDWMDWRKPANVSCRGDQSNCLTYFRINYQFDDYAKNNAEAHRNLMYLTDAHILDDQFKVALKYLTEPYGQ